MPVIKNAPASGQHVTIRLDDLRPGTRLRAPIYEGGSSDREVLLLAAGSTLTPNALQLLRARGVCQVRVHRSEFARLTGAPAALAARPGAAVDDVQKQPGCRFGLSADSLIHKVARHGAARYNPQQIEKFAGEYQSTVQTVRTLFDGLAAGNLEEAPELATVSADALVKITQDLDLFVALGVKPSADSAPGRHSLQTAMMAMSIGTVLGLKKDDLIELGIGCLIHDSGMVRVQPHLLQAPRALTHVEFLEITKHPAVTYDMLRNLPEVPTGARMVAYQMHERCNGSGYPRRRQATQIHPLAKVAAVADVFVALVSPRPWREGLLPYKAMEKIILDTQAGLFDPEVVRALLKTVSLFPIGSCIETNDGRVGKVVRTNRDLFTRPVVELWVPGDSRDADIVDLAQASDVEIMRPLANVEPPANAEAAEDFWE